MSQHKKVEQHVKIQQFSESTNYIWTHLNETLINGQMQTDWNYK